MHLFSVYIKRSSDLKKVEDVTFVCHKFSYKTFFFGAFYLLTSGLWVPTLLTFLADFFLLSLSVYSHNSSGLFIIAIAIQFYGGLLYKDWLIEKLQKNQYKKSAMIVASLEMEAKEKFYRFNTEIAKKIQDDLAKFEHKEDSASFTSTRPW